ncbi:hypothetical protein RFI_05341 [Reticulomyxa filosa]|uniref:C3H1-type domain-containing protein n=1 Tax=Reticulomyxa filosa TaxID=46433 RepID=X6NZP2_RETFI|nr:hypothetical protein RFI_05341 [Reticulomyxa filosa]|eukprot:ETO31780.1 hypothetical protein RFI_05341 [Reticulomyxa filosa]
MYGCRRGINCHWKHTMPVNPTVQFKILPPAKQDKEVLRDVYLRNCPKTVKTAIATTALLSQNMNTNQNVSANEKKPEDILEPELVEMLQKIKAQDVTNPSDFQTFFNKQTDHIVQSTYYPTNPYFAPINMSIIFQLTTYQTFSLF